MSDVGETPTSSSRSSRRCRVLEHVAEKGHEVTLTEVAAELKLPKTTVFRYLQTLTAASFLRHDRSRDRYGVGLRFRALAKVDKSLQRLRTLAQPEMAELGRTFNETINLGDPGDGQIVYIDMIEANRALRMQARIGDRHPLHSTSLGKAMLAFLPEPEQRDAARRLAEGDDGQDGDQPQGPAPPDRGGAPQAATPSRSGRTRMARCASACRSSTRTALPLAALSLAAPERRMTPDDHGGGDRRACRRRRSGSRSSSARAIEEPPPRQRGRRRACKASAAISAHVSSDETACS